MVFGIDVSEFQTGVDYDKAVRDGGVNFAILRAGYGRTLANKDTEFERHYFGFSAQCIPLGAYQYSYSDSVGRSIEEAKSMIAWCDNKYLHLGVWYDLEEPSIRALGQDTVCKMARAWVKEMENAGYKAGIYAPHSWFKDVLAPLKKEGVRIWSALWSNNDPPGYGTCWQFGGDTNLVRDKHVPGIPGACDQDYWLGSLDTTPVVEPSDGTIYVPIRQLAKGDDGDDVRNMQILLDAHGHSVGGCGFDGDFGNDTDRAVRAFQQKYGLSVDGICGKDTWTALVNS